MSSGAGEQGSNGAGEQRSSGAGEQRSSGAARTAFFLHPRKSFYPGNFRMSSNKEPDVMETVDVDLDYEDNIELDDGLLDKDDGVSPVGKKRKRKNASDVHPHFVEVEGKKTGFINFEPVAKDGENSLFRTETKRAYDQMKCREMIAKLIIMHELPFSFVEYHWFNQLLKYNNPLFQRVSRATIRRDCIKVVEGERERIKKMLRKVNMISLTSDCWTSNQTIGYMCLTAHFVDCDWKLNKCIIGFNELAPPHSGEVISDAILECLIKWGIQDKIGTITLDNASNNDRAATILMHNFQVKNKLHFQGLFFHIRCCAHILNLVVQDGLGTIESCTSKVREGVKYLKKSTGRLKKFGEIAVSIGIDIRRSLCIDVKTRWNSTHRMLDSAIYYKRAFEGYAARDSNYVWCPTNDEWTRAEKVCKLLAVFLKATEMFSGSTYPTTNLFLTEIYKVKREISNAFLSCDSFLKEMSIPMYEKFDKYWGEIGVLMCIASILDPRYKKLSVEWTFDRLYVGDECLKRVEDVETKLESLFKKYHNTFMASKASMSHSNISTSSNEPTQDVDDFHAFLKRRPVETGKKTELEVYLDEPNDECVDDSKYDVLKWWSQHCSKFPVLSRMAKDMFSILITTVASESAFSAGGRILDDYRSSLSKDMVELLVCGSDWLKSGSKATIKTLKQCADEEENLEIEVLIPDGCGTST
ncbi:zinc finger BED domain-containing protein RICESLEEPER 2-like [Helianthus annuus]|uniref:zinc finger BED domain-containing protein RICESLEEPER 2-like n=1 Tax=Helianthus annuus TaxID=4232 RepID=UPI00165328BC|nr:zinc finger BED domain-containing protein RICESLEEPER 2-like [Helianthus annuus]